MKLSSHQALVVVLCTGIVGTGLIDATLSAAGYTSLGTLVWIIGYGTIVLVIWHGWLRPLQLTGPADQVHIYDEDSEP